MSLSSPQLRLRLVVFLVFISSLVHHANAIHAVQITKSVRDFWWQVAWRAPGIESGVTLIAEYPVGAIQEDYFVWGPANLIYFPEQQNTIPIEIRLPAAVLTPDVVTNISIQRGAESPLRRGNQLTRDFRNVLVLTQATPGTCVRILDGLLPELSINDEERIKLVAFASRMDRVKTEGNHPTPPAAVFGAEPAHDWCYYYQKASLARQRGEWQVVADLGDEAQRLGLHPNDPIEWMPFLQAYAILGDQQQVKVLSTRINTQAFYEDQACRTLNRMAEHGFPLTSDMQAYVDELFCK